MQTNEFVYKYTNNMLPQLFITQFQQISSINPLVQPADRCLIQVALMSLVACWTVLRQLTMTLQALLQDTLTEPR